MATMINKEKNLAFLHFNKTAGTSLFPFLKLCGFEIVDPTLWGGHIGALYFEPNVKKFGFIRNPFDWYVSMFNFLNNRNWIIGNCYTNKPSDLSNFKKDTLNDFIESAKRHDPPWFNLMSQYNIFFAIGSDRECKEIFPMEDFWTHLQTLLKNYNIEYNKSYIEKHGSIKCNSSDAIDKNISKENVDYILSSCGEIFKRFSYKEEWIK